MATKGVRFIIDSVKLNGPLISHGGGYSVTFSTGDYSWPYIKDLPDLFNAAQNNGEALEVFIGRTDDIKKENKVDNSVSKLLGKVSYSTEK